MTLGFQQSVQLQQAAAVAGDFASANPRASVVGHEGTLVAGAAGVTVARFAWATLAGLVSNSVVSSGNLLSNKPTGFVHRRQGEALITTYLGEVSSLVPQGFEVTLMATGDYWVAPITSTVAIGQKVFANLGTGEIRGATAASTIANYVGTATFATNVMTVATVSSGVIAVGDAVTSAGVAAGTYVTAQLTGTPGGVGTYSLSTSPGTITPAQAATTTSYVETDFTITGFPVGGTGVVGELAVMSRVQ
jgi:hypothetical protein